MSTGNDLTLVAKICLEGFQSGRSWLTILRKRHNFREDFDGSDVERVGEYTDADVERLQANPGPVQSEMSSIQPMLSQGRGHPTRTLPRD